MRKKYKRRKSEEKFMNTKNIMIIVGGLIIAVFIFQYFSDYKTCLRNFSDKNKIYQNNLCKDKR
jgi:flagellar motor component MotA